MADESPLLTIELDKINSVPKVFLKGEEIKNKVHVGFDWSTQTNVTVYGSPFIDIEYFVKDEEKPYTKAVRYNGYFQTGENDE